MCKFFSAISDGNGKVLFFKPEDIAKIMSEGNKSNYEWNSHSSIAFSNGIKGEEEIEREFLEINSDFDGEVL